MADKRIRVYPAQTTLGSFNTESDILLLPTAIITLERLMKGVENGATAEVSGWHGIKVHTVHVQTALEIQQERMTWLTNSLLALSAESCTQENIKQLVAEAARIG